MTHGPGHCKSVDRMANAHRRKEDQAIKKGRTNPDGTVTIDLPTGPFTFRMEIKLVDGSIYRYPLTYKQRHAIRKELGVTRECPTI